MTSAFVVTGAEPHFVVDLCIMAEIDAAVVGREAE